MTADDADRSGSSRQRLARAAAASLALHMLLFGGLSVSKLDLATPPPDSPEAREPRKPKRPAADFRLQVSRSAAAEQPAHERPLELPVRPAAVKPIDRREQPSERTIAADSPQPQETPSEVRPSQPELEPARPRDTAATPMVTESPERSSEAAAAETAATAAPAPAAATVEAAAAAAAPAAASPRAAREVGRVAARWRPREVALLERLTARTADASALAARPATAATAAPSSAGSPGRRAAEADAARETRAEAIAPPAAAAESAVASIAPSAREAARRPATRGATASPATSAALAAAAGESTSLPATSPAATRAVSRSAATSPLPVSGSAAGGQGSPSQLARRSAATAAAAGGSAAGVEMPAIAAVSDQAGGGGQIAPAPSATAAGGGGRRGGSGSALTRDARRQASGGSAAGDASSTAIAARSGAATAGIGRGLQGRSGSNSTAAAGDGDMAPRPPGRDVGGLEAATAGAGTVADGLPGGPAVAATGSGGAGGTGRGPVATTGQGERLGPALIERGRRGTAGRSALAAARGGGAAGAAAGDADEEGLSISPADLATLAAAGGSRTGLPDLTTGPRSPERIAAAALPSDGRVRDIAAAFAGRRPAVGQPAGGIDDAADLDRARAMVERGLEFLARSQLADGRWRLTEFAGVTPADVPKLDSDTAATGLALLCFFGAGHDHFDGPHRDTVRRGLEFLLSVQKPDGDLFLPADDLSNSCGWLYSHGIAAIAVCEAVGMTGDPLVKPAAEKACRFIADSRHPTLGGWRYLPRTDADLSVSGWMLVALRAGELAGVATDPAALEGVRTLLAASGTAGDPTRFAYNARKADQRRTDLSVACMTAVGTLMRLHTGAAATEPGVAASAEALAAFTPSYGTAARKVRDAYLWYYASQVLVHTGGEPWERWYGSLVDTLEPVQQRTGELAGSWDAAGAIPDRWGLYGGRVYVTALHLLALEVPWRHLPTYAQAPDR